MTTHRTPGRSGISAQFLSLPLGGNFPGADVPRLSKPLSSGVTHGASPSCPGANARKTRLSHLLSAASLHKTALAGADNSGAQPFTAASASHAPHESTWSLSNRMHTASGAVRSGGVV